jgi:hypothetical protein
MEPNGLQPLLPLCADCVNLNWLSTLPFYEGRAAVEGVKKSISFSGQHNIKEGRCLFVKSQVEVAGA